MSITGANELKGRTAELGVKNEFTATRLYQIETDTLTSEDVVVQYVVDNIAAIASVHPSYSYAWCKSINAQQTSDDGLSWTATIEYGQFAEDDRTENPLSQPVQLEYDFQVEQVPIDYDRNNERIQNSCGDPPATAIEVPTYRLIINVTRNEATFDAATVGAYAGSVNGDSWLGFAAGQVQFIPGRVRREFDSKYGYYFICSYQFVVNTDGYLPLKLLDQGYRELNDDDEPVYILGNDDEKLTDPALLDGAGKQLAAGEPPVFREYDHLKQLPFSAVFNF
ncbi:MAG: hypothetical protein R3C18_27925 [Planctomycetaceae bacterium]